MFYCTMIVIFVDFLSFFDVNIIFEGYYKYDIGKIFDVYTVSFFILLCILCDDYILIAIPDIVGFVCLQ